MGGKQRGGRITADGVGGWLETDGGGKAMKWYKVGRGQGVGKGRVGKLMEVVERERRG
jgi:hypothetical protein